MFEYCRSAGRTSANAVSCTSHSLDLVSEVSNSVVEFADFSRHLQAVGCADSTVRIVSLDPDNTLETLSLQVSIRSSHLERCTDLVSLQALTAPPSSIVVADILDASIDKFHSTLFVNIGLSNGVLLRTVLDSLSGQLTDTRTR